MIVFLGPPGSGKGTQAALFNKRNNIPSFSIGDLLRKEVANSTEIGQQIANTLKDGKLVETSIIIDLINQNIALQKFILDGFPRNLEQAYELDKFTKKLDSYIIFDFIISLDLLKGRLTTRTICNTCNVPNSHNSLNCIFCGASSENYYIRNDDNNETINNRIKIYEDEHNKLIQHYENNKNYMQINANDDVENIYKTIRTCLISKNLL